LFFHINIIKIQQIKTYVNIFIWLFIWFFIHDVKITCVYGAPAEQRPGGLVYARHVEDPELIGGRETFGPEPLGHELEAE